MRCATIGRHWMDLHPQTEERMPPVLPTFSITVSTVTGWPEIRKWLTAMEVAAARVGGEVVVTDGSSSPAPDPALLASSTTWHRYPGLSVFQLREIGYRLARSTIVAVTEDHVIVPPDWGERLVAAFAATPGAMAIGGSVENGATDTITDWAAFFVALAPAVAPIESGPVARLAGNVNVAYRAEALQQIDDREGLGAPDWLHQQDLLKRGGRLIADDTIRVTHDQSCSLATFTRMHYDAGRTVAGFLRKESGGRTRLRLLAIGLVPYTRLWRAVVLLNRRGYGPLLRRAWPIMLWLQYAQAAGHFLGILLGPGDSPRRLR